MKQFIVYCIMLLISFSCSSNKANIAVEQYQLSISDKSSDKDYFNQHFEIAEIIALQTNDNFLISDIKRLIRYKDQIILLSGKTYQIFLINAKGGKMERCIHKAGSGPGESSKILDIGFDELSKQLILYNDYSKLLFFNLQGEFLSETQVDGLYEEITVDHGKIIFHNKLEGYSCYPYRISIFDIKSKMWEKSGRDDKVDFPIRVQGHQLVKSKRVWFTAPLDFGLFICVNDKIESPYRIDITEKGLNEDLIKLSTSNPQQFFEEIARNNKIYSFNSIRETKDYLVLRSNQPGLFIVDKAKHSLYWDKMVEAEAFNSDIAGYYYPHDGDDDKIMFILPPGIYTKHIKKVYDKNVSKEEVNAIEMKEDDNPALIFYRQKNQIK